MTLRPNEDMEPLRALPEAPGPSMCNLVGGRCTHCGQLSGTLGPCHAFGDRGAATLALAKAAGLVVVVDAKTGDIVKAQGHDFAELASPSASSVRSDDVECRRCGLRWARTSHAEFPPCEGKKPHANFIRGARYFKLNIACRTINKLIDGEGFCYLVGSALERPDFNDVDVRYIMQDELFARVFDGIDVANPQRHGIWSLLCFTVSEWLSTETGLNVDFQVQQRTRANAEHNKPRSGLGHTEFYPGGG
jgi:hypothetical protein